LLQALEDEWAAVHSESEWKTFRDRWMARKNGVLTQLNDLWLRAAPPEAKRDVGRWGNELRHRVDEAVETSQKKTSAAAGDSGEALDVTLPGIRPQLGAEHPVIKTMNEIVGIFRNLGYSLEEGPEIESDYYNFEALNFPPNHPARDTQDTLFVAGQDKKPQRERLLLRTHTSPVQRRSMEKH